MEENKKSGQLWSERFETEVINILKAISLNKNNEIIKNRQYYHIRSCFKLVNLGGITKVGRIKDDKIMATEKNAFAIIRDLHTACGHKGEKKTYKKVAEHYANIPMSLIKKFIEQCERCTEKSKKRTSAGIVVRPITSKDLNERGQVDLVDFQSLPEFKFILHYKEHLTKYSFLRPLTSKRANEVAREVLKFFLDFGAPHVLQSDNGREFTANIIRELGSLWPNLVLVNGRPRHPQSQGCVERGNSTIKDSLIAWMRDNKTSSWSRGLGFVQWGINTTYHEAIKMQPYKAVFGQLPKMGLTSRIPQEFLEAISNGILEENMNELLNQTTETNVANSELNEIGDDTNLGYNNLNMNELLNQTTETNVTDSELNEIYDGTNLQDNNLLEIAKETEILMNQLIEHSNNSEENTEITQTTEVEESFSEVLPIDDRDNSQTLKREVTGVNEVEEATHGERITEKEENDKEHPAVKFRQTASENILKQANRMISRSNKKLGPLAIGDNVLIGISEFDRGRGDPANMIGVVIAENNGKFRIGTKHGIVENWLERNTLTVTKFKKLKVDHVPSNETNIRT